MLNDCSVPAQLLSGNNIYQGYTDDILFDVLFNL